MTAETRESGGLPPELMNDMQKYMRSEYSPDVLANSACRHAALSRLALKAKDWCMSRGYDLPDDMYYECAEQSYERYMDNWRGKTPGEDDRGHRLGKPAI